jgi:hypothetical protein
MLWDEEEFKKLVGNDNLNTYQSKEIPPEITNKYITLLQLLKLEEPITIIGLFGYMVRFLIREDCEEEIDKVFQNMLTPTFLNNIKLVEKGQGKMIYNIMDNNHIFQFEGLNNMKSFQCTICGEELLIGIKKMLRSISVEELLNMYMKMKLNEKRFGIMKG